MVRGCREDLRAIVRVGKCSDKGGVRWKPGNASGHSITKRRRTKKKRGKRRRKRKRKEKGGREQKKEDRVYSPGVRFDIKMERIPRPLQDSRNGQFGKVLEVGTPVTGFLQRPCDLAKVV